MKFIYFLVSYIFLSSSVFSAHMVDWVSPLHGKENNKKYVALMQGLFSKYDSLTKDQGQIKEDCKRFLGEMLKLYQGRLTTKKANALKVQAKTLTGTVDPLILVQISALFVYHKENLRDAQAANNLILRALKDNRYGQYISFLMFKIKAEAAYHSYPNSSHPEWKKASRFYAESLIEFIAEKPIKDFDYLYTFEVLDFFTGDSKNAFKYFLSRFKEKVKDPFLVHLCQAAELKYLRSRGSIDLNAQLLKSLKELYELNQKDPFAPTQLISWSSGSYEESRSERVWWYHIAQKYNPDYVPAISKFAMFGVMTEGTGFLEDLMTAEPLNANHLEAIAAFYFYRDRFKEADFEKFYMKYVHPLAKKLEAHYKETGESFGKYANKIHNVHYRLALKLGKMSHIRKIHELYGDIIDVPINDQGKTIPYSYAVTGPAGELVKEINNRLLSLYEGRILEKQVLEFQEIKKDSQFARKSTNLEIADEYFDYVDRTCDLAVDFLLNNETQIIFDKHFSIFDKEVIGKYLLVNKSTVRMEGSAQKTQHLKTYLKFSPPYELKGTLKIVSAGPRYMGGFGIGKLCISPFDGRYLFINGAKRIGVARPANSLGPFSDYRNSFLSEPMKMPNAEETVFTIKVWDGAYRFFEGGKYVDTYIDKDFIAGAVGFGTPPFIDLGGTYIYKNISIKRITEPKPIKGRVMKYKLRDSPALLKY